MQNHLSRVVAVAWAPLRALGPPRDRSGRFVNWAGTVASRPATWHLPADEGELVAVIREAAARGQRVRVVGAGHSWSAIAAPEDGALAVSLARVASIDVAGDRVIVGAGARLCDVNAALAARGLALPIVGSIARQAIAGAIATGTHGSSLVHGNLSSLVLGVRLIDGRGRVHELGPDDARLDGARVHLGALGALTRVTLRAVPAFSLRETIESVPIADACARAASIARSAEYVKIWWLPHTPLAQILRYERTELSPTRRPSAATARWIDERIVHGVVLPRVFALHARRPAWIPGWNRAIARVYLDRKPMIGPSPLLLSTPMPARHRETEAAVPLARAGDALAAQARVVDEERVRVGFIAELRFVRGDTGWLSPAHGGDVAQLGAYAPETAETDRYFAGFWRAMRALGGRPHWGKELDHGADEIRARWPDAARFAALRDELDPARTFGGPWHARVLGP
jgi:FAD/FMN-containing dehydrogenase